MEGSKSEFTELRSAIMSFCGGPATPSEWATPVGYQQGSRRIRLCRTEDPLLISVAGGKLLISGKPAFLRLFAENLPCDGTSPDASYHVRFDQFGGEQRVSEASLVITLTVRS